MVKGARKLTSKTASGCSPITLSDFFDHLSTLTNNNSFLTWSIHNNSCHDFYTIFIFTHFFNDNRNRKLTSKTASGCSPITNSYLDIILKKGISTLIRSEVSQYYRQIKENIDSEIIANVN